MEPYLALFGLGFTGLSLMAVLGALGGHHGAHGHGHATHGHGGSHGHGANGHAAHGHGAHGHASHGHGGHANNRGELPGHHTPQAHNGANGGRTILSDAAHSGEVVAHAHVPTHHADDEGNWRSAALGWLSPRVMFTLSLGAGATGLMVGHAVPAEPLKALVSLAGGIGLEKLAVGPMWNAMMRFASNPARTLESAVLEEATALTNFDKDGCGLVSIDLDGHEMRVLGRLAPGQSEGRVLAGETLLVDSVDAARGQCVVRRTASNQLPQ